MENGEQLLSTGDNKHKVSLAQWLLKSGAQEEGKKGPEMEIQE